MGIDVDEAGQGKPRSTLMTAESTKCQGKLVSERMFRLQRNVESQLLDSIDSDLLLNFRLLRRKLESSVMLTFSTMKY